MRYAMLERCWAEIGVQGDRSCDRLAQLVHCRNCHIFRERGRQIFDRPVDIDEAPSPTQASTANWQHGLETENCLLFELGTTALALPLHSVIEVSKPKQPTRIAHRAIGNLQGLVNVSGELCLCLSLVEILGLGARLVSDQDSTHQAMRLVVLRADNRLSAFLVNRVLGVEQLPVAQHSDDHQPLSANAALKSCVHAIVSHQNRDVLCLDVQSLQQLFVQALYA